MLWTDLNSSIFYTYGLLGKWNRNAGSINEDAKKVGVFAHLLTVVDGGSLLGFSKPNIKLVTGFLIDVS